MSILDWQLDEATYAIADVESTGVNVGRDRVVEVSVVHLRSGLPPRLVLDTLVAPGRPVAMTRVHGINDEMLKSAPTFAEVAGDVLGALAGCVVVGHNTAFDLRALRFELELAGAVIELPYLDTLALRPMLGLGGRSSLDELRQEHRMPAVPHHAAAFDAATAGCLLALYLAEARRRGITTFRELASLKGCTFAGSLESAPLGDRSVRHAASGRRVSRASAMGIPIGAPLPALVGAGSGAGRVDYQTALLDALADLVLTDDELMRLEELRRAQSIGDAELRAVHTRVFTWVATQCGEDGFVEDDERARLARLHACLSRLGWAPGE